MDFLKKSYTGRNQWYWYVFTLLVIFAAVQIGTLPLSGYVSGQNPGLHNPELLNAKVMEFMSTNFGLALTLLRFACGFFALLLCVKYAHKKRMLDIVTGRQRLDWGRIFFGAGVWAILLLITFFVPFLTGDAEGLVFQFEPSKFFVLMAISLVLFPFQTSFEELAFRGYLMQWSTILFKYRWVAWVLTSFIFGLMHSANPEVQEFGAWIALPQYILMGLLLGYVTLKDNGMELALGIHAANNILSALCVTSGSSTLRTHALFYEIAPTASIMDSVVILLAALVFIWICNQKYKFMGNISLRSKVEREER